MEKSQLLLVKVLFVITLFDPAPLIARITIVHCCLRALISLFSSCFYSFNFITNYTCMLLLKMKEFRQKIRKNLQYGFSINSTIRPRILTSTTIYTRISNHINNSDDSGMNYLRQQTVALESECNVLTYWTNEWNVWKKTTYRLQEIFFQCHSLPEKIFVLIFYYIIFSKWIPTESVKYKKLRWADWLNLQWTKFVKNQTIQSHCDWKKSAKNPWLGWFSSNPNANN